MSKKKLSGGEHTQVLSSQWSFLRFLDLKDKKQILSVMLETEHSMSHIRSGKKIVLQVHWYLYHLPMSIVSERAKK